MISVVLLTGDGLLIIDIIPFCSAFYSRFFVDDGLLFVSTLLSFVDLVSTNPASYPDSLASKFRLTFNYIGQ